MHQKFICIMIISSQIVYILVLIVFRFTLLSADYEIDAIYSSLLTSTYSITAEPTKKMNENRPLLTKPGVCFVFKKKTVIKMLIV